MPMSEPRQIDLICSECPLVDCDEESLWCLFRFVTDPNAAQKVFAKRNAVYSEATAKRRAYDAKQYQKNREKRLAQVKANVANKRQAVNAYQREKQREYRGRN